MRVRAPAVAGLFYPADASTLRRLVTELLATTRARPEGRPKALIVPHAGYVYSAPIAASGHACLELQQPPIQRVVLLGTCHTPNVKGMATTTADFFETPLGRVAVDRAGVENALRFPQVRVNDHTHARDHALEVQLPFLQVVLNSVEIVPFLVGQTDSGAVCEVLESLWGGEETLLMVSSDLSHHHSYDQAKALDRATAKAIEELDGASLGPSSACGRHAIAGLLLAAHGAHLTCCRLDLRNSGDTAGPRDHVVGYGAWLFYTARGAST